MCELYNHNLSQEEEEGEERKERFIEELSSIKMISTRNAMIIMYLKIKTGSGSK